MAEQLTPLDLSILLMQFLEGIAENAEDLENVERPEGLEGANIRPLKAAGFLSDGVELQLQDGSMFYIAVKRFRD